MRCPGFDNKESGSGFGVYYCKQVIDLYKNNIFWSNSLATGFHAKWGRHPAARGVSEPGRSIPSQLAPVETPAFSSGVPSFAPYQRGGKPERVL